MSIDGVIISDLRRILAEVKPIPFFFLICGPTGSGKSTNLRAVRDGAAACGMRIMNGLPTINENESENTGWTEEKSRLFTLDFSLLRSLEKCDASVSMNYPLGTVIFLDDFEGIDYLLRMNGLSHRLESIIRRLFCSPGCTLVTSAIDINHLPQWLLDIRSPMIYKIRELTNSGILRCLRSLKDVEAFMPYISDERDKKLISCLGTRRDLIIYLCHQRFSHSILLHDNSLTIGHTFPHKSMMNQEIFNLGKLFGLDTVKNRIQTLVRLFMERDEIEDTSMLFNLASTTGILLHGPSGSGKTTLTKYLSLLYPDRFLFVNCASLFSKYLGESEERLRELFIKVQNRTPSVLILDDVDVIGASRGSLSENGSNNNSGIDVTKRMLAALLCELDGILNNNRVLVIATTNIPGTLDAALLRQGRFETLLYVPPLSFEAAQEMSFDFFNRFNNITMMVEEKKNLSLLVARYAEGTSAASLKSFLRELLEQQLEFLESIGKNDAVPILPSEALVSNALAKTTLLKRVNYEFQFL